MSVIEGKNPTSLRMKFDLGKDELTNKTKVKSKTYSNFKNFQYLKWLKLIIQHWHKFNFVYKLNNHNLI